MSRIAPLFVTAILGALLIGSVFAEYAHPAHRCAELGIEVCADVRP